MILGRPKNIEKYILVNSKQSNELHKLGFIPIYRYNDEIYYIKTKEIEKVVEKWN